MTVTVFDSRTCVLGEGPLWHPTRKELFWFDILAKKMLCKDREWQFEHFVSAAGWVDDNHLLIASETALFTFDLDTGAQDHVVDLEADNPATRSNDGRADAFGGFWIGTMGKSAENEVGAIYRFHGGELRKLFSGLSIPNSICFSPDGQTAYFTDTRKRRIMQVRLDEEGWPIGKAKAFVRLRKERLNPDGSVVDAQGCLWNAQWGANRVARYSPDGVLLSTVDVPAKQASCPAFGGDDFKTLFITSAADGLTGSEEGKTFSTQLDVQGLAEHRVIL